MQETVLPPPSVVGIMSAAKYLPFPLRLILVQAPAGSSGFLSYLRTFVSIVKNEEVYLSC